jgi:hypothetical protein
MATLRPLTARPSRIEWILLALGGAGIPLSLLVLYYLGQIGGILVVLASAALCWRALAMLAAGAASRLQAIPRLLLVGETMLDGLTVAVGIWAWVWRPWAHEPGEEWIVPLAIALWTSILVVHTARMAIYLSPSRGLQQLA